MSVLFSGVIKKKGKHKGQGYKDREFEVLNTGIFQYGPVGNRKKWNHKLKISDIESVEPQTDVEFGYTITKTDGRILYFAGENDQDKWKWINGFRQVINICNDNNWSFLDHKEIMPKQQVFIPLLKLSKFTKTNIWRWRFFYIDDVKVTYYEDPGLGNTLGEFKLKYVKKAQILANKFGRDRIIQVDIKSPSDKRSYFFSHNDIDVIKQFVQIVTE